MIIEDKKKFKKQIFKIVLLIVAFVLYDLFFYYNVTRVFKNHTSAGMQAKSVDLDKYLPFDSNSEVVKVEHENLTGELPIIDGAAALYPVFSGFVGSVYPEESVEFDGENFTNNSKLQYRNTRGAYKAIVDGDVDIIICAKPSKEQEQYAKDNSVELEYVPIGKEAFVFIVNKDNPVDNLSLEDVKKIYAGEITNWKTVGGENKPIVTIQRNKGSGSQTTMLKLMGDTPIKTNIFRFFGRSIGFSFRYYVEGIVENGAVKMLSIDGVYPNKENIANSTYPIASEFYAVYNKANPNENIKKLIDFILSDDGQEIVDKSGYVKVKQ